MENILYAYIRVSSKEQNEDRQRIAMLDFGVPSKNIYMDKQSGKDFQRPGYLKLIKKIEAERHARYQEHRPAWQELRGNFSPVARDYKGKGRCHRGAGHASAGYPAGA